MRIPGLPTLRRYARLIRRRFVSGALILVYHRIADVSLDPQLLAVKPQHFAEHLEAIRTHWKPTSLGTLNRTIQETSSLTRKIAITFDDGYADNLHNAKPLLEKFDIPGTVFISTGYIGSERGFWWDELERFLLRPGTLPQTLRLQIDGKKREWDLGSAGHYDEELFSIHRHWSILAKTDPTARQSLYRSLHGLLKPLAKEDREEVLNQLASLTSGNSGICTSPLTLDEVIQLGNGGLVDIGSHAVTHPVFSGLSMAAQRHEIGESKALLEKILGRPVTSFAYPFGSPRDYTSQTVSLVKEAGFSCACSTLEDIVYRNSDLFQLPRLVVMDWNGEEFSRKLHSWVGGQRM